MIKVNIKKQNIITNSAEFKTQLEAEIWFDKVSSKGSFGKVDRWLKETEFKDESIDQSIDSRQVESFDGLITEYRFPQEFQVEYIDRTNEILQLQRVDKLNKIRKIRDEKLSRVDQLVNIAYLNSWTTAEKTELRQYRQILLDATETYKVDMTLLDNLDIYLIAWPIEPTAI